MEGSYEKERRINKKRIKGALEVEMESASLVMSLDGILGNYWKIGKDSQRIMPNYLNICTSEV